MKDKDLDEKYYCPECLDVVPKDATKCPHCGAEYEAGEEDAGFECMICACEVAMDAKYCPRCGTVFLDEIESVDQFVKQIGDHEKKRKHVKDMEQDEGK